MGRRAYLLGAAVLIGGVLLFILTIYRSPHDSTAPAPLAGQSAPGSETPSAPQQAAATAPAPQAPPTMLAKAQPVQYSPPAADQGPYDLRTRLDTMQRRQPNANYDPQQVTAAVERSSAWTPVRQIPTWLPLKPEEFKDGRQFIKLDSLKLDTLMPGDELWIAMKENGTRYRVKIDSVETQAEGRVSSFGHLLDQNDHFSVTFTRGPSLTVGGMDTPDGHYVLQAHGADGWIASSQLLFKHNDQHLPPPEE